MQFFSKKGKRRNWRGVRRELGRGRKREEEEQSVGQGETSHVGKVWTGGWRARRLGEEKEQGGWVRRLDRRLGKETGQGGWARRLGEEVWTGDLARRFGEEVWQGGWARRLGEVSREDVSKGLFGDEGKEGEEALGGEVFGKDFLVAVEKIEGWDGADAEKAVTAYCECRVKAVVPGLGIFRAVFFPFFYVGVYVDVDNGEFAGSLEHERVLVADELFRDGFAGRAAGIGEKQDYVFCGNGVESLSVSVFVLKDKVTYPGTALVETCHTCFVRVAHFHNTIYKFAAGGTLRHGLIDVFVAHGRVRVVQVVAHKAQDAAVGCGVARGFDFRHLFVNVAARLVHVRHGDKHPYVVGEVLLAFQGERVALPGGFARPVAAGYCNSTYQQAGYYSTKLFHSMPMPLVRYL